MRKRSSEEEVDRDAQNTACPFPSCLFKGKSAHGVEIHFSLTHARQVGKRDREGIDGSLGERGKRRRTMCDLPTTLGGNAPRLEVDRRTTEAFAGDSERPEHGFQSDAGRMESDQEGGFLSSNPCGDEISSSPDVMLDFVALITRLHKCAGNGLIELLLRLLREHAAAVEQICKSVGTFPELIVLCKARVTSSLAREGFKLVNLQTDAGVPAEMYVRDAVSVLREQVASVRMEQLVTQTCASEVSTHVMNSELGCVAAPLVQRAVQTSTDCGVSWRTKQRDGEESFVGFLQLYSDKSQTSMKSSAFSLYPFHATLLNLTEDARREQIVSGRSVVAYLPVSLGGSQASRNCIDSMSRDEYRSVYRQVVHAAIDRALCPLREKCYPGMECTDKSGFRYRLHPVIGSYCADIPEAHLVLSTRFGNKTARPCHRCYVSRDDVGQYSNATRRCCTDTVVAIKRKNREITSTNGFKTHLGQALFSSSDMPLLKGLSLQGHPPILQDFPFMDLHPTLDIYHLFSFEPMHNLYLGVSKLLKECACERLRSKDLETHAVTTSRGVPRTFFSVRSAVLHELNKFVRIAMRSAFGNSLRMNVGGAEWKGFFGPSGVAGLLEARDMRCVDQIGPFMGAIMDRMCGEEDSSPVTSVFVQYWGIVSDAYQRNSAKGWSIPMVGRLAERISRLKGNATKLFKRYQASGMVVPKWHLLDHICEDLLRYGNLSTLDACLYEYSHGPLKGDYEGGSRRHRSALRETVARFGERLVLQALRAEIEGDQMKGVSAARGGSKPARVLRGDIASGEGARVSRAELAVECHVVREFVRDLALTENQLCNDGGFGRGHSFSTSELRACMEGAGYVQPLFDLASVVGLDGLRVFLRLMEEKLVEHGLSSRRADGVRVRFPNSCYVSGYPAPSLDNCRGRSGTIVLENRSRRFAQRIIAKDRFHGSSVPRLDDVMLQGSSNADGRSGEEFEIWFGQALQFVSFDIPGERGAAGSGVQDCDGGMAGGRGRDFCFLQYYEVVSDKEVAVDGVDKNLSCVRLRWSSGVQTIPDGTATKFYGMEPVDSIRGKVHVVPASAGLTMINSGVRRRCEVEALGIPGEKWTTELFYVNRFVEEYGIAFDVGMGKR